MRETDCNDKVKRLLKSELVKRGISSENLVSLLENIGVQETKASIDSKISRGTFGAVFLIQCLQAIGCKTFMPEIDGEMTMAAEFNTVYGKVKKKKVKQYARN